jgi:hypothetical protein
MFRFSRARICGATNTLVENVSLQSRSYLWRHKHARGKCFASVALVFVAPQTRSWKIFRFSRARICGATNTPVENVSFQSRSYLWRHKHARGKCFASVALVFVAPQTRPWKMFRFSRARICGATNTPVENVSFQSRSYLWRHRHALGKRFASVAHKHARGKWP